MQFVRSKVPDLANYPQYRPFLQRDFKGHCAYCTGHEHELGGTDHFDIDHFRPKALFPTLVNVYSNLYYSCHGCNKNGAKGSHWPSRDLIKQGYRFFDPVKENAYAEHLRETARGHLIHKTKVGEYSIRILRLNRDGLIVLRKKRNQMRKLLRKELKILRTKLEHMDDGGKIASRKALESLHRLKAHLSSPPILSILPDWWE